MDIRQQKGKNVNVMSSRTRQADLFTDFNFGTEKKGKRKETDRGARREKRD